MMNLFFSAVVCMLFVAALGALKEGDWLLALALLTAAAWLAAWLAYLAAMYGGRLGTNLRDCADRRAVRGVNE